MTERFGHSVERCLVAMLFLASALQKRKTTYRGQCVAASQNPSKERYAARHHTPITLLHQPRSPLDPLIEIA
jgi:hypothetical protein